MSNGDPSRGAAVALTYDRKDSAPRVVAKGYGVVAESIIARAKESGVYVHDSPALVNLLMQVDMDSHIPPQLYVAVAELLAWLYQLEEELANDTPLLQASASQSKMAPRR